MEKNTINPELLEAKLLKALRWIVGVLESQRVPFQITGGLAAHIYEGTRKVNDIDLDIPEEDFPKILELVNPYIVFGPEHYSDRKWDLYLLTLNYEGQDIGGAFKTRIFDSRSEQWVDSKADLSTSVQISIGDLKVSVVNPQDLIKYKSLLDGEHQLEDIVAVRAYVQKT